MQQINEYLSNLNTRFKTGISTEHTFRSDLQILIESIDNSVLVTNEPSRISCGAPDYIITKRNIPIGYIEAKDLGTDLNNKNHKEQFDRYKKSLSNLIITDYLSFQFFRDGELVASISIGEIHGNKILPKTENFSKFLNLIKDFLSFTGQTIKSASKLSKMMAAKARLLSDVIEKAILEDENQNSKSSDNTLINQLRSFKEILIHDITPKEFADIYAQTISYGMFAARLHDNSLDSFSRHEAAELIPKSNPFLRKLFQYIAGYDLDDRIQWIVDALADIFRATDIKELLKDFGKQTQQNDPVIHFYETFLAEYDPKLRKSRGVWYTPEPVVNFIVRAVDDILKSEFNIPQGLADTSKVKIKIDEQGKKVEEEFHKVQILDPAAGTGTFLSEVVKQIYKKFENQQGIWNSYVDEHLIPRLNGFEILMASYAMAHLKLDLLLKETNYTPKKEQRFKIYLTNSLEEHHPDTGTLFANWLSQEANEANHIKRDTPVMVVLGNPPYSGISSNNGEWITNLINDYKYIDGEYFNERKHWLNDDYVKFIRFGQHFIEKNGSGILAFINPHGFLDNPTFRGMRWNLLKTYDKIFTIDLHGNSKKKEVSPDGSKDENVFDIMQGVSINLFVKTGKKKQNELGKVFHFDLFGKREFKYEFLNENNLKSLKWNDLEYSTPNFFFVKKNFDEIKSYEKGFKVDELLKSNACGIVSARDNLLVHSNLNDIKNIVNDFKNLDEFSFRNKYNERKDSRDWTYIKAKEDILNASIEQIDYRPFDTRFILYSPKSKGILSYPRNEIMKQMISKNNFALLICKQQSTFDFQHIFITKYLSDKCSVSLQTKEATYHFPLYLYPENSEQQTIGQNFERVPNLNFEIVNKISEKLKLQFTNEKEETENTYAPIDILDYIYAVLHSPNYREKYKEFLKIDFPRVPYPKDKNTFWKLVELGKSLREIHLLENPVVENFKTSYPVGGTNEVEKIKYENGKVRINEDQYFDNVNETAWNFYIGGYQPAQKWLKDRKGRSLNFEDVLHYQKIIAALTETDKLMKEIDKNEIE